MSAKSETLGSPVELTGRWMFPEYRQPSQLTGPGIIKTDSGLVVAVKHPRYRTDIYDTLRPDTYEGDIIPLIEVVSDQSSPQDPLEERHAGIEAEFSAVDQDDGSPFDLYPGGEPIWEKLSDHPELLRNTCEISGEPRLTMAEAYRSAFREIRSAHEMLLRHGALIDPASARMQDSPGEQDITPNPYVGVMARVLGENILKFLGTGIHEHHELHIAHAPIVTKYGRVMAPHLNLGLQAAPSGFGEQAPRLGEILQNDELKEYDGKQPQSIRYPTRFATSPNGGVGLYIAHNSVTDALRYADAQLTTGEIGNPARLYGSHADVRIRFDAPGGDTKNPGRIELCVKDTAALRLETLIAYGKLSRAVITQLERTAADGEEGIARLHRDFPRLFGSKADNDVFAETQLSRAHRNSLQISYDSADAQVENGEGRQILARTHFNEIIRFATSGKSKNKLAPRTINILLNSLASASEVEKTALKYRDELGLPSLEGYYKTGIGTAASWMILRANAAKEQGIVELDTLRDGTLDRARSFQRYLGSLSLA